jgi:hypothetical protein
MENPTELYTSFDAANHLKPDFKKSLFKKLHSWDLGWALLQPINIASSRNDDKVLTKRFSPGQKALYFFWYLDAQVTNSGFIQFYWNGYREYLPPIIKGLKLIGDETLVDLLSSVDNLYISSKLKFEVQQKAQDWAPLYKDIKEFEDFDQTYYTIHNNTMELIEKYAREFPSDFVNLKGLLF